MPHAARADDARVVVRMGPLAHHVDLHGLVGRVRRRARSGAAPSTTASADSTSQTLESLSSTRSLTLAPLRTTSNRDRTLFLAFGACQVRRGYPRSTCGIAVYSPLAAGARRCPRRPRRADARRRRSRRARSATARPTRSTGTLIDGTVAARRPGGRARGPPLSVRGLLPRDRAHDHRRRRQVHVQARARPQPPAARHRARPEP